MRYLALAADYDGTLATHGTASRDCVRALERLRDSGRKLILVTGRELPELLALFPEVGLFHRVVAENGGFLYNPSTREKRALAAPPPHELIQALERQNVEPLSVGNVLLASREPFETEIVRAIRELGLEYHIVFNKGAVMALPSGVNKATGLAVALQELGLSPHNVVGVGDGENDHAFLELCECFAAVGDAVPSLKSRADWVAGGAAAAGVGELIELLLASDLKALEPRLARHHLVLGTTPNGETLRAAPYGQNILLSGAPRSGKSTLAAGFLERLSASGYQFCVVDPEGEYRTLESARTLGSAEHPPQLEAVAEFLKKPSENLVVNLLAVPLKERPAFFKELLARIQEARARFGRPHWVALDQAHQLCPVDWKPGERGAGALHEFLLITVHPHHVAPALLAEIDLLLALAAAGDGKPATAWAWFRRDGRPPVSFRFEPPKARKSPRLSEYAEGELAPERSFYFRGPGNKMNLRAQNLKLFVQLARGIDEETWLHHLRLGDYSRWFERELKDPELAAETAAVERDAGLSPGETRARVVDAVESRYAAAP